MKRQVIIATLSATLISWDLSTARAQDPGIYSMISEMRRQSHADALTIKEAYAPLMESTSFDTREDLERALADGTLVPLDTVGRASVQPRLAGESPIAQKDLEHQSLYVAARPAVMGMLISIADRAEGVPIEITSLVRSADYQRALMRGNGNANTDVPTHVMGYAVDIGLKFTPATTASRIRQALEEMRAAGDIYFIGEANQLTFHIVPVPSRIAHFEEIYRRSVEAHAEAQAQATAAAPADTQSAADPQQAQPQQSRIAGLWSWLSGLFD